MGAPTKDELLAQLKDLGVNADPKLTNVELQELIDRAEAERAAADNLRFIGAVVLYQITEADALAYNRERDGLSRFLKASRGGPLPSVRVRAGDVVPVIVVMLDDNGALCGNAQMPGGGVLWVEGFDPYEED